MSGSRTRTTHTYVYVDVSPATFAEISAALKAADYGHAFLDEGTTIDMYGLALRAQPNFFQTEADSEAFLRGTKATHELFLEACQILPEDQRDAVAERCMQLASGLLQPAEVQS